MCCVDTEAKRESTGGISYEVILKPASSDAPLQGSPPKAKAIDLSKETIEQKLQRAEEKRKVGSEEG